MKAIMTAAALAALLAGCGTPVASTPTRTVTVTAPAPSPAASPTVSATCEMGYVNYPVGTGYAVSHKRFTLTYQPDPQFANPPAGITYTKADYVAMRVTVTVPSNSPAVDVYTVTIVWYAASGQEIGSGGVTFDRVITPGQTLTRVDDQDSDSSLPRDAATCAALS